MKVESDHFGGNNGAEFMENLGRLLAEKLEFSEHGKLTESEQIAFMWGFRHGIHQMHSLTKSAAMEGASTLSTIMEIFDEAVAVWALGIHARVRVADLVKSNDTKH
jgi:hypothetical protein